MPIQPPQWTEFLSCPVCYNVFNETHYRPISLACGHTVCRLCLSKFQQRKCPFDQSVIARNTDELPVNFALLQLVCASAVPDTEKGCVPDDSKKYYESAKKCVEELALLLKPVSSSTTGSIISSHAPSTTNGSITTPPSSNCALSRPMQRKLICLVNCQLVEEEGRARALRAARSLGERTVTELILQHQNPQQLSSNLWAAVRGRGCQFLGPGMQEEVLKLILLALEDGSALSRKVLVLFVVQRLEAHYPQASKTAIGHVVQLLYRASCFMVTKREEVSSLMQLKEDYRTYETLRREHDSQIVQIAMEAGLRIAPDQWSSLLYGDATHKSHMQSIIDKLQTPQTFSQSVSELLIALQRTSDPHDLQRLQPELEFLSSIDPSPDVPSPSWENMEGVMKAVKTVVEGLVFFLPYSCTKKHDFLTPFNVRYKTSLCRDYIDTGSCPRGSSCTFAHSEEELDRYRQRNKKSAKVNNEETDIGCIGQDLSNDVRNINIHSNKGAYNKLLESNHSHRQNQSHSSETNNQSAVSISSHDCARQVLPRNEQIRHNQSNIVNRAPPTVPPPAMRQPAPPTPRNIAPPTDDTAIIQTGHIVPPTPNIAGQSQSMISPPTGQVQPQVPVAPPRFNHQARPPGPSPGIIPGQGHAPTPGPMGTQVPRMNLNMTPPYPGMIPPPYMSEYPAAGTGMPGPRFPMHPAMMYNQYPYPTMHQYMSCYPPGHLPPDNIHMSPYDNYYNPSLNPFAEPWNPNSRTANFNNQYPQPPQNENCSFCRQQEEHRLQQENLQYQQQRQQNNHQGQGQCSHQQAQQYQQRQQINNQQSQQQQQQQRIPSQQQQEYGQNQSSQQSPWQQEVMSNSEGQGYSQGQSLQNSYRNEEEGQVHDANCNGGYDHAGRDTQKQGRQPTNSGDGKATQEIPPIPVLVEPNAKMHRQSLSNLKERRNNLIAQLQELNKEAEAHFEQFDSINEDLPNLYRYERTDINDSGIVYKDTLKHPRPLDTGPYRLKSQLPSNGEIFERLGALSGVPPRSVNDSIMVSWTSNLNPQLDAPENESPNETGWEDDDDTSQMTSSHNDGTSTWDVDNDYSATYSCPSDSSGDRTTNMSSSSKVRESSAEQDFPYWKDVLKNLDSPSITPPTTPCSSFPTVQQQHQQTSHGSHMTSHMSSHMTSTGSDSHMTMSSIGSDVCVISSNGEGIRSSTRSSTYSSSTVTGSQPSHKGAASMRPKSSSSIYETPYVPPSDYKPSKRQNISSVGTPLTKFTNTSGYNSLSSFNTTPLNHGKGDFITSDSQYESSECWSPSDNKGANSCYSTQSYSDTYGASSFYDEQEEDHIPFVDGAPTISKFGPISRVRTGVKNPTIEATADEMMKTMHVTAVTPMSRPPLPNAQTVPSRFELVQEGQYSVAKPKIPQTQVYEKSYSLWTTEVNLLEQKAKKANTEEENLSIKLQAVEMQITLKKQEIQQVQAVDKAQFVAQSNASEYMKRQKREDNMDPGE